ncbi:MAG: type II toxin-antitoxin system VapC family toxin [Desulfosalsimonadaceae bacterium]|nr:type II toxin-antitoxin system VapC family toxin [Desulfosalsimonadaceae bacterium]
MSGYLFDSHALLAFFQNEPGAEIVAKILRSSMEQDLNRLICMINVGEILYLTKRRFGDTKKLEILSRIHQLGFRLLSVTDALVFQAAEYKAQYAMSYADCFALACAIENSAVLITGDPEFQAVSHLVKIEWIR